MRPTQLDPLFAPVSSLPGIGPRTARQLAVLLGTGVEREPHVIDLLLHLPTSVIDRRARPGIAVAPEGEIVTLEVRVDGHQAPPRSSRAPYRIRVHDDSGELTLVFFRAHTAWLEKTLPVGADLVVSGRIEWFNGQPQMVHPDHIVAAEDADDLPLVEPVYPLTQGLSGKTLQKAMTAALDLVPDLDEWLDPALRQQHGWPSFRQALLALHHPDPERPWSAVTPELERLAFDEFLASQLALALVRRKLRQTKGIARVFSGGLKAKILAALPYALTAGQAAAVAEIEADLSEPVRMLRLLQGDVGAGKTIVALLAVAAAVEAGTQAVMMAPTEILARQHHASLAPLCEAAGIRAAVLTGKDGARYRRETREALAAGELDLVIGTHALFQGDVAFHNLGLAVVDEQHRFGVHQRLSLSAKGDGVDMLVMTATPIPRTLVLTYFGDMDVSRLTEKPAGRQEITTVTVPSERMDEVVDRLHRALDEGRKAYWVCPLVEESEKSDLAAAEERFEALRQVFGDRVALVHGRLSSEEKSAAMTAFKDGEKRLLVATTVIEVGVDVPDATIMVIEHAERFGLSQLHQLRGRVGRGAEASTCLLLYKSPIGEVARARLAIMRETNDGFRIAEEDLRLRGEGEILGTRQSGTPGFKIARADEHASLLDMARDDAKLVLETDGDLTGKRGPALRSLLYLFSRDEAIRLLRAG
ncbi:ATP-dependent DNA helicase RecG [Stappia taiwanensis]|uniref:ATP-dependent DNA helicase RecG n=1 Tax=Stappia taiwanensis TaxID=992267 RepID=A0A838XW01_9HYPH|nr:ATP-dependent DNA helicase RecG [Stappia taiwanensis]MBA4613201.1 ATP-dependent DNA helicase RecG [Stappia taiwanensis]GGE79563.1 ATP-dependent DNA helicase RecG [Stappia taiwanensis]